MAIILITWGVSTLIRLALSRSREFLADAGSAELTKNPDALVRALRKIETNAALDVPSRMEAFFIENPVAERVSGLFSTHPSVGDRVEALQRYAGAAAGVAELPKSTGSTSVARLSWSSLVRPSAINSLRRL